MSPNADNNCSTTIYRHFAEELPAEEALSFAASLKEGAAFLIYSPEWCGFGVLDEKGAPLLRTKDGFKQIDDFFELRLFTSRFEFRWVREYGDLEKGKAVLLTEEAGLKPLDGHFSSVEKPDCFIREGRYLLWGAAKRPVSFSGCDWTEMFEHRIGFMDLPLPFPGENTHCFLRYMEYFDRDEFWNLRFMGERLLGIEV